MSNLSKLISPFFEKVVKTEDLVELDRQIKSALYGDSNSTNRGVIRIIIDRGEGNRDLFVVSNGNKYRLRQKFHNKKDLAPSHFKCLTTNKMTLC